MRVDDDYLQAVLDLVVQIPRGWVMTYGTIAEVISDRSPADERRGGPRQVGYVLSRAGGGVPWWRVVNAAGGPAASHLSAELTALASEGTPLAAAGLRVDLRAALWWPVED